MADPIVKNKVVARLRKIAMARGTTGRDYPLVRADDLGHVAEILGLSQYSNSKLGDALRSLHNAGTIRCARPRVSRDDHRPYELYLK